MSSSLVPLALSTPNPLKVRPLRLVALTLLPSIAIAVGALPVVGSQAIGTIEPPAPAPAPELAPDEPPTPDPAPPNGALPPSPALLLGCELPPEPGVPAVCAEPPACGEPPRDDPVPAPAGSCWPALPLPHETARQTRQTQRKPAMGIELTAGKRSDLKKSAARVRQRRAGRYSGYHLY